MKLRKKNKIDKKKSLDSTLCWQPEQPLKKYDDEIQKKEIERKNKKETKKAPASLFIWIL